MRSLSARVTAGVFYACLIFAVATIAVGIVGILGVRSAADAGNSIVEDELSTATLTARLSRSLDTAYSASVILVTSTDSPTRTELRSTLYETVIPAVDRGLVDVERIHAGDDAEELTNISELQREWAAMRRLLDPGEAALASPTDALVDQLAAAFAPISQHLDALVDREHDDATAAQAESSRGATSTTWGILVTVALAVAASGLVGWVGSRRIRRAVEPAQEQVEFADLLQLAEDEEEAHLLLKRHLERTVTGGAVTVLNRNNSADRLEAMTTLAPDSPLVETLQHAEPRSCLAVRSGRTHDEDDRRPAMLGCPVCAVCPGKSTCNPLTVGGVVIGSILMNRATRFNPVEDQSIRDSVAQAAPVLANLRNLAIAELRAATDSLTGLPNKRAVGDNLKRMLAQASRTLTPLSLLLLDLDHFKDINDRFGHPIGDQALANVGAALRSALRDSDFSGRNGGEEFAVMLPDTDIAGAILAAEKIRAAIAQITLTGVDITMTASVGVACYPDHATNSERLERLADSALYVAKRSGRNRVEIAIRPTEPILFPDPAELDPSPPLDATRDQPLLTIK